VPPELLAEISHYHAGVDEQRARIASHDSAELAARQTAVSDPSSIAALIVAFGPIVVLGGGNELVKLLELLPADIQRSVDSLVQGGTGVWFVLGTAGYLWYRRAQAKRRARAFATGALGLASCPNCGAPNAFVNGRAIERCAYCGSDLVAHAEIMRRGLDVARSQERRARLDRLRTERSAAGMVLPKALDGAIEAAVYVLGAALALAAGYFLPIVLLHDEESLASYAELIGAGAWLLGILGAISAIVLLVRLVTKRSEWQVAQAALASRLGAERVGTAAARRWLDTYWAGPFDAQELGISVFGATLTTTVDGFPVFLLLDTGPERQTRSPRIAFFLAASYPAAPPEVPVTLRRKLAEHGFYVENTDGGLYANANDDVIQRLHERPMDVLSLASLPGMMTAWLRREGEPAPAG
jgi:hypothetical protein